LKFGFNFFTIVKNLTSRNHGTSAQGCTAI